MTTKGILHHREFTTILYQQLQGFTKGDLGPLDCDVHQSGRSYGRAISQPLLGQRVELFVS